jgi:hypothetical protein
VVKRSKRWKLTAEDTKGAIDLTDQQHLEMRFEFPATGN